MNILSPLGKVSCLLGCITECNMSAQELRVGGSLGGGGLRGRSMVFLKFQAFLHTAVQYYTLRHVCTPVATPPPTNVPLLYGHPHPPHPRLYPCGYPPKPPPPTVVTPVVTPPTPHTLVPLWLPPHRCTPVVHNLPMFVPLWSITYAVGSP